MNNFLCTTKNVVAGYNYCTQECKYYFNDPCKKLINCGYQQAIDDFVKRLDEISYDFYDVTKMLDMHDVEEIAKQLKEQNNA